MSDAPPHFEILAAGLAFPEAPVWSLNDDCLYWTEWTGDRVGVWRAGQAATAFQLPAGSGPSGLAQTDRGDFWLCLYDAGTVMQVNCQGRTLHEVLPPPGQAFRNPCDLALAQDGGLFFTDSGDFETDWRSGRPAGVLFRMFPGGGCERLDHGLRFPNGLALTPAGQRLYLAEHRANRVWAYTFHSGGCTKELFFELDQECLLPPDQAYELGPDGLCVDGGGNLWIVHYGGGKLVQVSAGGDLLRTVPLPHGRKPTNLAWQAAAGQAGVLAVTEAEFGRLYRVVL